MSCRIFALSGAIFALTFCNRSSDALFTAEEKKAPFAIKETGRDGQKSSHVVLMNGAEKPHYHDVHSVEVKLISGQNKLHLADRVLDLKPGESIRVEKGTLHWAENAGPGYSLLFVDFYPPFDGQDRRFSR